MIMRLASYKVVTASVAEWLARRTPNWWWYVDTEIERHSPTEHSMVRTVEGVLYIMTVLKERFTKFKVLTTIWLEYC